MSIESKAILAKLMAQENLHIEQRAVSTASFNTKTRVLTVPILNNDIKPWTYDLFMGHEVGHALWTFAEDLEKAFEQKINKAICNIVEDSRIERLIKVKYPGLKNSFSRAYKELFADNFFGTDGLDLNKMNFIDRINLYCKVGVATGIKFNDEESVLLKEVETTQTFDEVVEVVKKIQSLMEQQEEEERQKRKIVQSSDDDIDDEELEEMDDEDGSDELSPSDISDGEDEQPLNDERDGSGTGGADKVEDSPEITSHTEQKYRENEKKLFAENAKERVYANVPKVDIKKAVMDYKEVYSRWHLEMRLKEDRVNVKTDDFIKIRNNSSKTVSYLVKEFELRKNADQLKRTTTAKTGDLNMNKIFSYKFNEDIFKKVSVNPGGKSHGLVMFLDWSGSMGPHIDNTIKQLISLVLFCKKVNIPYEVYAFNTPGSYYHQHEQAWYEQPKAIDCVSLSRFRLLNLLSSRMNASELTKSCASLISYISTRSHYRPPFLEMGGTPLNEAIITAMEIVPEFKKQNRLQIVNTVFLTDGEGSPLREVLRKDGEGYQKSERLYGNHDLVIVDPVTKNEALIKRLDSPDSHTEAYLKLFKQRTGSNVVGFYIIAGRDFGKSLSRWFPDMDANMKEDIKVAFRKNKYKVITNAGYDEYYVLRSEAMDTEEETELEVKENATTRGLVSAFNKYAGGRVSSRVVLNKFIGMIA